MAFYVIFYLKRTLISDFEVLANEPNNVKDSKHYSMKFLKKFKLNLTNILEISEKLNESILFRTEVKEIFNNDFERTKKLSKDIFILQTIRIIVQTKLFKKCLNCIKLNLDSQEIKILLEYLLKNKYCQNLINTEENFSFFLNIVLLNIMEYLKLNFFFINTRKILENYKTRLLKIMQKIRYLNDMQSLGILKFLEDHYVKYCDNTEKLKNWNSIIIDDRKMSESANNNQFVLNRVQSDYIKKFCVVSSLGGLQKPVEIFDGVKEELKSSKSE